MIDDIRAALSRSRPTLIEDLAGVTLLFAMLAGLLYLLPTLNGA